MLDHLFKYNGYDYNDAWNDDTRYACLNVELRLLPNLIVFLLILLQSTGIVDKTYLPYRARIPKPYLTFVQRGGGMKHDLRITFVNHSKVSIFNSKQDTKGFKCLKGIIVPPYIWISSKFVFQ